MQLSGQLRVARPQIRTMTFGPIVDSGREGQLAVRPSHSKPFPVSPTSANEEGPKWNNSTEPNLETILIGKTKKLISGDLT